VSAQHHGTWLQCILTRHKGRNHPTHDCRDLWWSEGPGMDRSQFRAGSELDSTNVRKNSLLTLFLARN
jgi:hypothetical protein